MTKQKVPILSATKLTNETYKYMGRRNYSKKGLDKTDKNFLNFKIDKSPDFAMQCREIIPRGLQVNPLFHF